MLVLLKSKFFVEGDGGVGEGETPFFQKRGFPFPHLPSASSSLTFTGAWRNANSLCAHQEPPRKDTACLRVFQTD